MGRPVAKRIVDGIFQCPRPAFNANHFCPAEFHLMNVDALPLDIDYAHKDFRFHPEQGPNHRRSQSVLAGAGLGNELGLAHIFG